ncbi:Chromate transporter [Caldalkalibacillus thermarum TA2.A1]|uniref:Chromate transporter n=1 Tax=Caldalkalibacillus thermarum (strain TA2.A1) TaxID=986075 RepID=F5L4P4_CALTT|nr:chromate transporter [Caldalkalibacillus thermarum]EGL83677.1 Chromate transporter [Caldalkalibacillus thermarum TA2.A1]QZT34071.1 chromate transporter [Caldalkalibacillus thermarum TA2.A1]
MDLETHRNLFIGFFRAGMLGYGGGPSSIPLIHKEVVETYKWMTDEEFSDILALGNTLPGPIATKMAGYIGFRVAGILGLMNAIVATVMPTVILMIALIGFLASFRDSPVVQGMTKAVGPVVGVMLFTLAYSFFKQSKQKLGWPASIFLGLVSLIAYHWLNIHPAVLIGVLLCYGLFRSEPGAFKAADGDGGEGAAGRRAGSEQQDHSGGKGT